MSNHPHSNESADPTFAAKQRSTWEIVKRVAVFLKPYKLMSLGTMACALLSLAFSLAYPHFIGSLIDDVIQKKDTNHLTWVMVALLGSFLLRDLFNGIRILINNTLEQNVIFDMRCNVYARLQRLPVHYFDQRASGDLMTRVIEDVNSVERILIDGIEQGSVALLSVFIVPVVLFRMSPILGFVAMVPVPLLMGGALWYTLTARKRYRAQRQAASAMNALLMDNLQGVRQIKSFGQETHEDGRFAGRADDLRKGTLAIMRVYSIYGPAMTFSAALGTVLISWVGGWQVIHGALTPGQLVRFLFYLALFYEPIRALHGLNQLLQAARASGERVFDILDFAVERMDNKRRQSMATPVRGEVVYEKVGFGYSSDKEVLRGISLHARPGEMIALVGPTGAGKSTLVNMLPAFYEITSGCITIDGQDITGLTLESLRRQISIVSQEPFLFNGTIRENILYGNLSATEADLLAAAKAANCHEFIARLPTGYDSRVGERGVKLSVGEKQRVSIARALLKNAPILILDEATASVDTGTEKLIQEALERLMANRTSFVIAHRLSTIRKADQILVLRDGEIVERGNHDELLALNGLYARLARIQNTVLIEEGFEKLSAVEQGAV
ncbi:MAG TPA: ABC transporter ATP-binding protein [Verrucomicrobiae bacterium]|nr:ABC transporter ATP-binding protein [Verrucomicrobiae bacterium]